jgi:tyrosinase
MHAYEQELQTCGWKGGVPYWDWTLDAAGPDNDTSVFFNSPIFDNKHGFGGNGGWVPGNFSNPEPGLPVNPPWDVPDRSGGGCIKKGPFAGLKSNLGPGNGTAFNPNCIRRDFAPLSFRDMSGPDAIKDGMGQKDFGFFDRVTESTFHSGGHWGVGGLYGTMTDKWQSRKLILKPSIQTICTYSSSR